MSRPRYVVATAEARTPGETIEALQSRVDTLMAEGYIPTGGVAYVPPRQLVQAMYLPPET